MAEEERVDVVTRIKELLAEPSQRIVLYDFVVRELKKAIELLSRGNEAEKKGSLSREEFAECLNSYEEITRDLRLIAACIAFWGEDTHHGALALIHSRIADTVEARIKLTRCQTFLWYPLTLILYSAGVAALAAKKYSNLASIFEVGVTDPQCTRKRIPLPYAVGRAFLDMNRERGFEILPGHERQLVPRSEHILELLQTELEGLLFLGQGYGEYFDQLEIFLALSYGYFHMQAANDFWAPIGRFGLIQYDNSENSLRRLLTEARMKGNEWEPIRVGLFPAGFDQFNATAIEIEKIVRSNH